MAEQLTVTRDASSLALIRLGFVTVENLWVLWPPAPGRGKNRILGHRDGSIAYPRRKGERRVILSLFIEGEVDSTGVAHAAHRAGLEANLELLGTFFEPNDVAPFTIGLSLTMPSGAVREGPATVEDFDFVGISPTTVRAALDLTLVDGELVVVTP